MHVKKNKSSGRGRRERKYYKEKKGTDSFFEEKEGKFLVYREGDRKTLKSINYSPAQLKKILED